MRACSAEHRDDPGQSSLGAGTHVQRLNRHPDRLDADQRKISRSQAALAAAALDGQFTTTVVAPRSSSMRMFDAVGEGVASSCTGMNAALA